VHLEPEILLVDEAFAVGDETFQRQCLRRIHEFKDRGVTIVLVSHDLLLVERLATRVCLVQGGRLVTEGPPGEVIGEYHRRNAGGADDDPGDGRRWGSREIELTSLELLDDGRAIDVTRTRRALTVRLHYRATARVERPVFGISIHRDDGVLVTGPNTKMSAMPIDHVDGSGSLDYRIDALPLVPGRYLVSAAVYDDTLVTAYDHRDRWKPLVVLEGGTNERFGVVELGGRWTTT
jgi:hypothetical protein